MPFQTDFVDVVDSSLYHENTVQGDPRLYHENTVQGDQDSPQFEPFYYGPLEPLPAPYHADDPADPAQPTAYDAAFLSTAVSRVQFEPSNAESSSPPLFQPTATNLPASHASVDGATSEEAHIPPSGQQEILTRDQNKPKRKNAKRTSRESWENLRGQYENDTANRRLTKDYVSDRPDGEHTVKDGLQVSSWISHNRTRRRPRAPRASAETWKDLIDQRNEMVSDQRNKKVSDPRNKDATDPFLEEMVYTSTGLDGSVTKKTGKEIRTKIWRLNKAAQKGA